SGVLSAWFRRLLICHGRMRNTAYSFITSFLGHIRVWDYPNKQNARALYGKRGHFSQTGTRLLCLLCSCFYPYTPVSLALGFLSAAYLCRAIGAVFRPVAARRNRAAAYRATLQIGFPAAGDLFAKLPVGG